MAQFEQIGFHYRTVCYFEKSRLGIYRHFLVTDTHIYEPKVRSLPHLTDSFRREESQSVVYSEDQ